MQRFQKFMFDTAIFDDPARMRTGQEVVPEPEGPPPPPPPPTYTAEQVIAARIDAWQAGLRAGMDHGRDHIDYQQTMALSHLAMVVDQWSAFEPARIADQDTQIIDIALAISRKMFPLLAERGMIDEMRHAILQQVIEMPPQGMLTISVPAGTHEKITGDIRDVLMSRGLDQRFQVIEDSSLADGDCQITWGDGGKQRIIDRLWPMMEQIARDVLAGQVTMQEIASITPPIRPTLPQPARFVLPDMPPADPTPPDMVTRLPEWMVPWSPDQLQADKPEAISPNSMMDTEENNAAMIDHSAMVGSIPAAEPVLSDVAAPGTEDLTLEENQA